MKRNTEAIIRLAAEKSHNARSRVLVALQELSNKEDLLPSLWCARPPMSRKHFCTIRVKQTWQPKSGDYVISLQTIKRRRTWCHVREKAVLPKMHKSRVSRSECGCWNARHSACARKMLCSTGGWRNGRDGDDEAG